MADIKSDLSEFDKIMSKHDAERESKKKIWEEKAKQFFVNEVIPAFTELKETFEKDNRKTFITNLSESILFSVYFNNEQEFSFEISTSISADDALPMISHSFFVDGLRYRREPVFWDEVQHPTVEDIKKGEIKKRVLGLYKYNLEAAAMMKESNLNRDKR